MPATGGIARVHIHIFEPLNWIKNILKQPHAHFLTRMFSLSHRRYTEERESSFILLFYSFFSEAFRVVRRCCVSPAAFMLTA